MRKLSQLGASEVVALFCASLCVSRELPLLAGDWQMLHGGNKCHICSSFIQLMEHEANGPQIDLAVNFWDYQPDIMELIFIVWKCVFSSEIHFHGRGSLPKIEMLINLKIFNKNNGQKRGHGPIDGQQKGCSSKGLIQL